MGSYVSNLLMPGEEVILEAKTHWGVAVPSLVVLVISLLFISGGGGAAVFGVLLFIVGLFMLLAAFIRMKTTELALTSKRVVAKAGVISRVSVDINLGKVEGVTYNQSIVGRMLGYGSIVVRGTGGGGAPIVGIAEPEKFRNAVSIELSKTA